MVGTLKILLSRTTFNAYPATYRYLSNHVKKKLEGVKEESYVSWVSYPSKNARKIDGIPPGREPLVYLFGWAGSQKKDIEKYGQIYENLGFPTIQSTASLRTLFPVKSHTFIMNQAKHLLELRKSENLSDRPVIFHILSNGGSNIYFYVSKLIRESHKDMNIVGLIYDSAPAVVIVRTSLQLIVSLMTGPTIWKYITAIPVVIRYRSAYHWGVFKEFLEGKPYVERRIYNKLLKEPNICPELYLYSKIDLLTCYKGVERFIKERNKMGVDTMAKRWEDTEHVAHMRKYREEYITQIHGFLKRCLFVQEPKTTNVVQPNTVPVLPVDSNTGEIH